MKKIKFKPKHIFIILFVINLIEEAKKTKEGEFVFSLKPKKIIEKRNEKERNLDDKKGLTEFHNSLKFLIEELKTNGLREGRDFWKTWGRGCSLIWNFRINEKSFEIFQKIKAKFLEKFKGDSSTFF